MNSTEDLIKICNYALMSDSSNKEEIESMSQTHWLEIIRLAVKHGLRPVVVDTMTTISPNFPEGYTDDMFINFGQTYKAVKTFRVRIANMRDLASLFNKKGIDIMFMKGAAIAQYYPKPYLRSCSDIDYYLYGKSKEGDILLKENGCHVEPYFHHHTQSEMRKILIENHFDFLNRRDIKSNRILDDTLKKLAEEEGRDVPYRFDGHPEITNSYCMTPTMNSIFILRHILGHYVSETIIIRQLYDWALFLQKDGHLVDWKLVEELYNKTGMIRFANIIRLIIIKHLHINIDDTMCGIPIQEDSMESIIWDSIIHPSNLNPYKRNSIRYKLYEIRCFFINRKKYHLCYPNDSYWRIFITYSVSHLKKLLGLCAKN